MMLGMVRCTTTIGIKTGTRTGKVDGSVVEMRIGMMIAEGTSIGKIERGATIEMGIEEETPIGMDIEILIEIWIEEGIQIGMVVVIGGGRIEVGRIHRDREVVVVEEDLIPLPLPRKE